MKTEEELQKIGDEVIEVICEIYDPEIPVNIYALGLIYDVQVSEDCDVKIIMTLTSPNCPVAESLPVEIEEKVKVISSVIHQKLLKILVILLLKRIIQQTEMQMIAYYGHLKQPFLPLESILSITAEQ